MVSPRQWDEFQIRKWSQHLRVKEDPRIGPTHERMAHWVLDGIQQWAKLFPNSAQPAKHERILEHRRVGGEEFMPPGWCGGCEICASYSCPDICLACSYGSQLAQLPVDWPCAFAVGV